MRTADTGTTLGVAASHVDPVAPRWMRAMAVLAPLLATLLGAAMAVQWAVGGGVSFDDGPPGAATVGRWMADTLPLMDGRGDPLWVWRGPFFIVGLMTLPLLWKVTAAVRSRVARWSSRGGLLVATGAMAVEYNSASGYGWLIDLAALAVAAVGTAMCGLSVLRGCTLPSRVGWAMLSVLPLTPVAGLLTFWYLPPGLAMGLLLSWAVVSLQPLCRASAPANSSLGVASGRLMRSTSRWPPSWSRERASPPATAAAGASTSQRLGARRAQPVLRRRYCCPRRSGGATRGYERRLLVALREQSRSSSRAWSLPCTRATPPGSSA